MNKFSNKTVIVRSMNKTSVKSYQADPSGKSMPTTATEKIRLSITERSFLKI